MRCARGRSTSTSLRTTPPSKAKGSHDKTGRHCLVGDPNGKLDITRHAGYWLRDDKGELTKAFKHICWDGCMFPNSRDDEAKDLGRHSGRDGRRARRARLARSRRTNGAGGNGNSMAGAEEAQRRHGRLRLHGPDPFERVRQGQPVLRPRLRAGAEGRVRPRQGQGRRLRQDLGLRIVRDRLAQARRADATSISSISPRPTTRTPRSRLPPPRPAKW